MVAGVVAGAGLAAAAIPVYSAAFYRFEMHKLELALLLHGFIWGILGALGGLAFAIGTGRPGLRGRAMLHGMIGALVGMLIADMIGAFVFPMDGTDEPISGTWYTRLIARVAVAVAVGIAVGMAVKAPPAAEPSRDPSPPSIPDAPAPAPDSP
jgi:hypothetical protein